MSIPIIPIARRLCYIQLVQCNILVHTLKYLKSFSIFQKNIRLFSYKKKTDKTNIALLFEGFFFHHFSFHYIFTTTLCSTPNTMQKLHVFRIGKIKFLFTSSCIFSINFMDLFIDKISGTVFILGRLLFDAMHIRYMYAIKIRNSWYLVCTSIYIQCQRDKEMHVILSLVLDDMLLQTFNSLLYLSVRDKSVGLISRYWISLFTILSHPSRISVSLI